MDKRYWVHHRALFVGTTAGSRTVPVEPKLARLGCKDGWVDSYSFAYYHVHLIDKWRRMAV
jgi:hypothetical protein